MAPSPREAGRWPRVAQCSAGSILIATTRFSRVSVSLVHHASRHGPHLLQCLNQPRCQSRLRYLLP